ncbi:hypothetical protein HPB47_005900, partial [Ixodes persulcatus]
LSEADVLGQWEQRATHPGAGFELSEPVSWLQGVVLRQLQSLQASPTLTTTLLHYTVQARCNNRPLRLSVYVDSKLLRRPGREKLLHSVKNAKRTRTAHCECVIHREKGGQVFRFRESFPVPAQLAQVSLKELERQDPRQGWRWTLEGARIQLAMGDCTEAQHTLWRLLGQLQQQAAGGTSASKIAYAEVLQLYGECLAEARSENSDTIAREYLDKAVHLLEGAGACNEALWTAHLRLARFADGQLQGIDRYLGSPEFQAKQDLLTQSSQILDSTPSRGSREDARALRLLERQSDLDRGEAAGLRASRTRYLLQALGNYLRCLQGSSTHDLRLFRLASLWVGNASLPDVNALLQEGLMQLESYKFVPLIYQLAARMSRPRARGQSDFATLLFQLIERVVREHPHQTLPVVLALCNAEKDAEAAGKSSNTAAPRAKKAKTTGAPAEDRVEGARLLVSRLRQAGGTVASTLPQLERLMDAYIQLAYLDPPQTGANAVVTLPRDILLLKLGCLDHVPVLTQTVEVDRSCCYSGIGGIARFEPRYQLCGGINMPKVVTCVGQDGHSYKQLVKGRDDLRQDAVMQQAFELVNQLLRQQDGHHKGAGKLRVRTYKVVPLSRRSGLVQWCKGTQPFAEFLLNSRSGAHLRYQPRDWTFMECRKEMQLVTKSPPEDRLSTYRKVCRHFHPVFRYFFFENFPEPVRWFERRRAYVRSVATGSIVGYILGLGDRHCANILVDKHTAELIHIDL